MKSRSRRRKVKRSKRSKPKVKTGCPPKIALREKEGYDHLPNYVENNFNKRETISADELYLRYPKTTRIDSDHPLLSSGKIMYYTDNYLVVQTSSQVCIYDADYLPFETYDYEKVYQGSYVSVLPGYNLRKDSFSYFYHGNTVLIDIGHGDYICVGKKVVQLHIDHPITHYYSLEIRKSYLNPEKWVAKFWFDTEDNVYIVKHDNTIYKLSSGRNVIEKVLRGDEIIYKIDRDGGDVKEKRRYIPYENDDVKQREKYKPYVIETKGVEQNAFFDPHRERFGDNFIL